MGVLGDIGDKWSIRFEAANAPAQFTVPPKGDEARPLRSQRQREIFDIQVERRAFFQFLVDRPQGHVEQSASITLAQAWVRALFVWPQFLSFR